MRAKRREERVPKLKTHSGASKRFKVTASGRLVRRKAHARHKTGKKSAKVKRLLREPAVLAPGDSAKMKKLLRLA